MRLVWSKNPEPNPQFLPMQLLCIAILLAICLNAVVAKSTAMLPPLTPLSLGNHKIKVRGGGVDSEGALAGLKKGWEVSHERYELGGGLFS
jgi:hypothetical protein